MAHPNPGLCQNGQCSDCHSEQLGQFHRAFPRCSALKIEPVWNKSRCGYEEGFDVDELRAVMGARFAALEQWVAAHSSMFCCAHRSWPLDHAEKHKQGREVHCIYARDLEKFLGVPHA